MNINLADPNISPLMTKIICGLIVLITFLGIISRYTASKKNRVVNPWTTLAPNTVITLGIFGTFLGIYLGLINFDTSNINDSIPNLLEGLKTAFITSLFGMFFSLIIKFTYGHYEKKDSSKDYVESDDPIVLLRNISNGISNVDFSVSSMSSVIEKCFKSDEDYSLVSQLKIIRSDLNDLKREIIKSLDEFGEKVAQLGTEAMIEALRNVIEQFNARLNDLVGEEFKQLRVAMEKLVEWQEHHRKSIDEMQNKLSEYLNNVEKSTQLLERAAVSINNSSVHLNNIDESLSSISVSSDDIEKSISQLNLQNKLLEESIVSIKNIGEQAKNVVPSLDQHIKSMTTEIVKMTQNAKDKITESSKLLEDTVIKLADKMQNFTDIHAKQTEKSIELIQKNLQTVLSRSLSSLAGQLASLSNKFAEDYTPLTNQLREIVRIAERVKNVQ